MIKLLDRVIEIGQDAGSRRCVLTKDEHNWILITAPSDADDDYLIRAGKRYFYSSFEEFLSKFLMRRFRALLTKFDDKRVLQALSMSLEEVRHIGRMLDQNAASLLEKRHELSQRNR